MNHVDLLRFVYIIVIVFSPGDLVHVHSCTFTVVPTNVGKYQVSVKHTTVSIYSIIVFFECFFVSICTKFLALFCPTDFRNPMVPS